MTPGRKPLTKGELAEALGYDSTDDGPDGERARALGYDSTDETPWTGARFDLTDLPPGAILTARPEPTKDGSESES